MIACRTHHNGAWRGRVVWSGSQHGCRMACCSQTELIPPFRSALERNRIETGIAAVFHLAASAGLLRLGTPSGSSVTRATLDQYAYCIVAFTVMTERPEPYGPFPIP
jgi:hypothetical protein